MEKLRGPLGFDRDPWTAEACLPGGDLAAGDFNRLRSAVANRYQWLSEPTLTRMCQAYGSRIDTVLAGAKAWGDLGKDHGSGLTEREVRYLVEHEWACEPDDILWRRTKLGLHMSPAERAEFTNAPLRKGPTSSPE